uniref:Uncharacterized protein n=1 Tax=Knipowitschia caucasica TaxID=637954 RepID=A0AAV2MPU8_KNICA
MHYTCWRRDKLTLYIEQRGAKANANTSHGSSFLFYARFRCSQFACVLRGLCSACKGLNWKFAWTHGVCKAEAQCFSSGLSCSSGRGTPPLPGQQLRMKPLLTRGELRDKLRE